MACFSDLLNDGLLSRRPVFGEGQTVHTIFHQLVFEEVPLRVSPQALSRERACPQSTPAPGRVAVPFYGELAGWRVAGVAREKQDFSAVLVGSRANWR